MKNYTAADVNVKTKIDGDRLPTKIEYWNSDLHNYNPRGELSRLVNPGEFKKKLETVNLFVAILVTVLISLLIFF